MQANNTTAKGQKLRSSISQLSPLLQPLHKDLEVAAAGWVSQSLLGSISRTVSYMYIGWQLLMVVIALQFMGWQPNVVAALHLLFAGFVLLGVKARPTPRFYLLIVGAAGLTLFDYAMAQDINSALAFAATWQFIFANCAVLLVVLSRWIVATVLSLTLTIGIGVLIYLPEWGTAFFFRLVVTQFCIVVALRIGFQLLLQVAQRSDIAEMNSRKTVEESEYRRRMRREISEKSSLVHDAAINTLAVLGHGGISVADLDQVKRQAKRDVKILRALKNATEAENMPRRSLQEVFQDPALPIIRTGLDDPTLEALTGQLDDDAFNAVIGAIQEALLNAKKHAGVKQVSVNICHINNSLQIEISDAGHGFSGHFPEHRGLAKSIFGRAQEYGFEATLETEFNHGTVISLIIPMTSRLMRPMGTEKFADPDLVVRDIHRRAALLWSSGVTLVNLILAVTGNPEYYHLLFPMVLLMLLINLVVQQSSQVDAWRQGCIIISIPALHWLAAGATEYGTVAVFTWQALAVTGSSILLLSYRRSRKPLIIGFILWLVAVILVGSIAGQHSSNAVFVSIVAAVIALVFTATWHVFMVEVTKVSKRTAEAHQRTFEAQLQETLEQAAQETHRRWIDSGIELAIGLLEDIENGVKDPQELTVQQECKREEQYLRQIITVSPHLLHLGQEIMPTLRLARQRGVQLQLRLGETDVVNRKKSSDIVTLIDHFVRSTARGQVVNASVFPVGEGLQVTVVGPQLVDGEIQELLESGQLMHQHVGPHSVVKMIVRQQAVKLMLGADSHAY